LQTSPHSASPEEQGSLEEGETTARAGEVELMAQAAEDGL